jgi:NNP family nitrate/nitrite transporter-like MFS transporter
MNLKEIKSAGHWPTLLSAFLYFDVSFMVWTILGPLGAQIGASLHLAPEQKGLMVACPILAGAVLRIVLGLAADRFGAKRTGIGAQIIVAAGLAAGWMLGLPSLPAALAMGVVLGFAGASFAVALPQAGRWYPPHMQGLVLGLAGAGNVGVVLDSLFAPRLAAAFGWQRVFGLALIPVLLVLGIYSIFAKDAPGKTVPKTLGTYGAILKERDAHWFCFYYTVSFGGFVGLASSFVLYFTSEYGLTPVHAGDFAALCTLVGAVSRPFGGAISDRIGGTRALLGFYMGAAACLVAAATIHPLGWNVALLLLASGCFGMANGGVFQLLPQRFPKEIGLMTGLVGCFGGIGGFLLATGLGYSKGYFGNYTPGLLAFAGLTVAAAGGLVVVKSRWRSTWGALADARI